LSPYWRDSCIEDLYVEFIEDLIHENEDFGKEMRLKYLGYSGIDTGDEVFDRWERMFEAGLDPDLDYQEDDVSKARDALVAEAARRQQEAGGPEIFIARLPDSIAAMEAIREGSDYVVPRDSDLYRDEGDEFEELQAFHAFRKK